MSKSQVKRFLDVSQQNPAKPIIAKQHDINSRFLKAVICDSGRTIAVPQTAQAVLNVKRSDGETNAFTCQINPNGTVTAPLTQWMLAKEGDCTCSISIYTTDQTKLSTTDFTISIEEQFITPDDFEDDPGYSVIVDIISQATALMGSMETAEALRVANESAREDAEAEREQAEAARETSSAAAIQNIASAITSANTACSNAANAAEAAVQAKQSADTAATNATQAAAAANSAANSANQAAQTHAAAVQAAVSAASEAAANANTAAQNAEKVNISAQQTATGADITVTDRTGAETTVHIDTITAINGWNDVKNAVRLGLGEKLFPVGYEFTTHDSATGNDITWVVVAHDHHTAANSKLTNTMTLETKQIYSQSNGAYVPFQFDAPEALYYAADGLAAGTYKFTLLAGYDTSHGGGKTLSFTLTKPVPAGGVIMFPWNENMQSTSVKISTYASQTSAAAIETVSVTESTAGSDLGMADGSVPNMNNTVRIRYSSNNYAQSSIRQWLNSAAAIGEAWQPATVFDRPPSWAANRAGFMNGLPEDFLAAVEPAIITCRTNSAFETNSLDGTEFETDQIYTLKDKFFILSQPEVYGTWESTSLKDGEQLEYYADTTNTERIKYDASGTARTCWLRTPYPSSSYHVRNISTTGVCNYTQASYVKGITPACIIA